MRRLDVLVLAQAVDDRGVVLVHGHAFGAAQVLQLHALQLDADIFRDGLAAGEGGNVFEHGLAAVAEARRLHGAGVQGSAQLVDHESGQRFAFHFLGDDQQRLAGARDLLEQRQQVLHVADFLLVDQDVRILEHGFHAVRVGDEVRGEIAAVELHALDRFQLGDSWSWIPRP